MDIKVFKSWDIKRKIGFVEIFLSVILLSILLPYSGFRFNNILILFFFSVLLFRWRPVPLRKYAFLTFINAIPILLYFLYGPVIASFWILIFVSITDTLFKRGVFRGLINGSAFALAILIAGSIFGSDVMENWQSLFFFFLGYYIIVYSLFYLSEFILRKTERKEIVYILKWEFFYYLLTTIIALTAYWIIVDFNILNVLLFTAGFLVLRWFIRHNSFDAIEGAIYRDLIKLQADVIKSSFEETIEAVVSYSRRYIDWTWLNIGRVDYEQKKIPLIYSTIIGFRDDHIISIDEGLTGRCVKEGNAVIVRDTGISEEYIAVRSDVKSEMLLPLIFNEKVIGVLDFEHNLIGAFSEKEVEYGEFFASQLAYTLQTNIALKPLVKTSEELNGFTDETYRSTNEIRKEMRSILDTMENVIGGGEEQIKSIGEVEMALEHLLTSHENIKVLREELSRRMKELYEIVGKSRKGIEGNLALLDEISTSIESVGETVESLSALSNSVMDIVDSSKEIAEDTSLLALNASIEASRSKGSSEAFSVIAEEINALATTSSANSDKISENTRSILKHVKDLTNGTENVVKATRNIEVASSAIMEHFDVITGQVDSLQEDLGKTIEIAKWEIQDIEALGGKIEQAVGVSKENIDYIKTIDRLLHNQDRVIGDLNKKVATLREATERLGSVVGEFRLIH